MKIFLILCMCIYSFANEAQYTKNIEDSKQKMKEFSYLEKNVPKQLNEFQEKGILKADNKPLLKSLSLAESSFAGDSFLTKEESKEVSKRIKEGLAYQKKTKEFVLYFFSESVPRESIFNFLMDMDILIQNGFDIKTKQYMFGYPKEFQEYLMKWKNEVDAQPNKYKKVLADLFELKLDPRLFKAYKLKRVPVMALAECKNDIPEPSTCKIRYIMHGNVPLVTFFDKIAQEDKKYKEHSLVLNANQIYKPKFLSNDINSTVKGLPKLGGQIHEK